MCVAALVLQRWSLGDAQPPEREALRAALQRLQVEPAERLRTCTELIDSNSGELVERTAGLVDRCAHLAGAESPLACGGEGAAADTPSAALTLHLTPRVTPRTFAVEMVKLLPLALSDCTPQQTASALSALSSSLEQSWGWEGRGAGPPLPALDLPPLTQDESLTCG